MTPVEQLEQNIEELQSTKTHTLSLIDKRSAEINEYLKKVSECDEMIAIYQDALNRLGVSK